MKREAVAGGVYTNELDQAVRQETKKVVHNLQICKKD